LGVRWGFETTSNHFQQLQGMLRQLMNGVNQKNFGLFFTIWLDTPAMQSSPHPAEQNKMFTNARKLKCLSKQTDQIQA
jgi:hypothetical protein